MSQRVGLVNISAYRTGGNVFMDVETLFAFMG